MLACTPFLEGVSIVQYMVCTWIWLPHALAVAFFCNGESSEVLYSQNALIAMGGPDIP